MKPYIELLGRSGRITRYRLNRGADVLVEAIAVLIVLSVLTALAAWGLR